MKRKILSIILCVAILVSCFSGCANQDKHEGMQSAPTVTPDVSVTVIDPTTKVPAEKDSILAEEAAKEDSNIESMVYSAIAYDLQECGYVTGNCMSISSDNEYKCVGLGFYTPDFQLFADPEYASMGFITVIGDTKDYNPVPTECEYVALQPLEEGFSDDTLYNMLAYTCENMGSSHFVFENKYVVYYQLDSTTIKYDTYENKKENYDLSLGSLYDFDNDVYLYDASLFDGYETHSATELFSEEDYLALEKELQQLSAEQEKNGYSVDELEIVYISPESIQAYLMSEEEDTFFGYSVSELEKSIGLGTALVYTENGLESAAYYENSTEEYNWKGFLTKVGIGAGIIIVGAIVSPLTGGASFGCALVTISTITVSAALVEGLGTLAIETAFGMMKGQEFSEAIRMATGEGLDAFANTFLITAAITTVGVGTGAIKPFACFAAGTMVAIPDLCAPEGVAYKPIEEICDGDVVYSYDESTGELGTNVVTEVKVKNTDKLVYVSIGEEKITTTCEHPFCSPERGGWIAAAELCEGNSVLLLNGEVVKLTGVEVVELPEPEQVYNFTVANDHTYFVSEEAVLVHNDCDMKTLLDSMRNDAVRKAWKREVEAVKNGTSKYNWTRAQKMEILNTGKLNGYQGCHIRDVHIAPELAGNPDNIIFLTKKMHLQLVHGGNYHNESRWGEVLKIMPQFREQVMRMGGRI